MPPVEEVPARISALCRIPIVWIIVLVWRSAIRRIIAGRVKALLPRVFDCKTAAEVEDLLGKPIHQFSGRSRVTLPQEGIDWLKENDSQCRAAYEDLSRLDNQRFESQHGETKGVFLSGLFEKAAAAGFVYAPARILCFRKSGWEFILNIAEDNKVICVNYAGIAFNAWDEALELGKWGWKNSVKLPRPRN